MKSSFHSSIPFSPSLLNHLRLPILIILSPAALKLISWQAGISKLDSSLTSQTNNSLYTLCTDHAENNTYLLLRRRVYRALAEQWKLFDCCLRILCRANVFTEIYLAVNVYSDVAIPAFGRHVTIFLRDKHIQKEYFLLNSIHFLLMLRIRLHQVFFHSHICF
jgi:hypothetical protein